EATRAERPDYILHDGACPWGLLVARILQLPAVTSLSLMPAAAPSLKQLLDWETIRLAIPILFRDFDKGLAANRLSRALGKKYGIPPLGMLEILSAYGDLCVSYTSSYFAPFASQAADKVRLVGWTPTISPETQHFSLEQALGRRLIYVSLGTIDNYAPPFFRTCIEAFTGSDA